MIGDPNDKTNLPNESLLTDRQVSSTCKAFSNNSSVDIKNVLIPLGLTASASAADAGIHKNILGSGNTTLIVSNKDMDDLIKIVKFLQDSGLLLKGVTESVQNELKEQKGRFLSMLLGTLGPSLLGNPLTGKGVNKKGKRIHRAGEVIVRAGEGNKLDF